MTHFCRFLARSSTTTLRVRRSQMGLKFHARLDHQALRNGLAGSRDRVSILAPSFPGFAPLMNWPWFRPLLIVLIYEILVACRPSIYLSAGIGIKDSVRMGRNTGLSRSR